jgi:hypothetical protein
MRASRGDGEIVISISAKWRRNQRKRNEIIVMAWLISNKRHGGQRCHGGGISNVGIGVSIINNGENVGVIS